MQVAKHNSGIGFGDCSSATPPQRSLTPPSASPAISPRWRSYLGDHPRHPQSNDPGASADTTNIHENISTIRRVVDSEFRSADMASATPRESNGEGGHRSGSGCRQCTVHAGMDCQHAAEPASRDHPSDEQLAAYQQQINAATPTALRLLRQRGERAAAHEIQAIDVND